MFLSLDIKVQIHKDGNLLNLSQLKKEYEDWIVKMHRYDDDEADCGEDQPVFVVSPANKKALRISSEGRSTSTRSLGFLYNTIKFISFVYQF